MPLAYKIFESTMIRATKLMVVSNRLANVRFKKEPKKISKEQVSDIARSTIVFGVSAFDAYFTNKFLDILVPFIKKRAPNKEMVKLLSKSGLDIPLALELLQSDRPFKKIKTLVRYQLENHVTQKMKVINKLFLCIGIKNLSKKAEKKSKRKTLIRSVEIAINRRHSIVHGGDLNNHGNLKKIKISETITRLKNIRLLVYKCEEIINSRLEKL